MRLYIGQTRADGSRGGHDLIGQLQALPWAGEMVQPKEYPPRRRPWAADNAAFSQWNAGRPYDGEAFASVLRRAGSDREIPDLAIVPDQVAGGLASLAYSLGWLWQLRSDSRVPTPRGGWYIAVQDGMGEDDVRPLLRAGLFGGLFVGGSLPWKMATAARWVAMAHEEGARAHIGRVGSAKRIVWARGCGADSADSALPLWSRDNLRVAVRAMEVPCRVLPPPREAVTRTTAPGQQSLW